MNNYKPVHQVCAYLDSIVMNIMFMPCDSEISQNNLLNLLSIYLSISNLFTSCILWRKPDILFYFIVFRKNWRAHRRKLSSFYSLHHRARSSSCFSPRTMVNKKFCLLGFFLIISVCLPTCLHLWLFLLFLFVTSSGRLLDENLTWDFNCTIHFQKTALSVCVTAVGK